MAYLSEGYGKRSSLMRTISRGISRATGIFYCLCRHTSCSEKFVIMIWQRLSEYISLIRLATMHACLSDTLPCGCTFTILSALEVNKTGDSHGDFRGLPRATVILTTPASEAVWRRDIPCTWVDILLVHPPLSCTVNVSTVDEWWGAIFLSPGKMNLMNL